MTKNLLKLYFEPLYARINTAARRFPLTIVLCMVLYLCTACDVFHKYSEIIYILTIGIFWSVTARLWAENFAAPAKIAMVTGLAGYLALGGWAHYLYSAHDYYSESLVGFFAFVTMFIVPFINRKNSDRDFWNFNYAFWSLLIIGFSISVLFFASGAAILAIVQFMTGFKMPFVGLWLLTALVFGPLFVLSNLPFSLTSSPVGSQKLYQAQCNTQAYLVVPLFLIYSLIFYLYAGFIVTKWKLPDGALAYYVMGFGVVGMISYFTSFGLAAAKPLLDFYRKNFYRLLTLRLFCWLWQFINASAPMALLKTGIP